MSNYEELNNPAIEELNPEALEQAAGGKGREDSRLRVTKNCKIYLASGQAIDTVSKGTVFNRFSKPAGHILDFECYRVFWGIRSAYIPCDCAEII